ncbi:amidohydrolase family protein [Pseudonocardia acaciae]|uniref:amidohydrolase family protein n=1 Tax=Pseudonocardia acaciae TaxID=551276 RepID=UPI00056B1B95|nr:amidohydrolase family protein [Pseudonocardia acaciae]
MTAPLVDTHLHLWDLARSPYRWITPAHGPLHTTIGPDRAATELNRAGVPRAVLVQADDTDADTDFMLEVAHREPWVAGVVGWVRLDDPAAAAARLDELAGEPALRGIRHLVHDDPRDDFLRLPAVRTSLRLLAGRGLAFDVPDAWPRHLADVADLAAGLPELTVVLDHLGKPPADPSDLPEWRRLFAAIAARPNTVAKLSGLQHLPASSLRPVFDAALELFGPDRLAWGSDWPMTLGGNGYPGTLAATMPLVDELTADERAALLGGTAERVYRLGEVRS